MKFNRYNMLGFASAVLMAIDLAPPVSAQPLVPQGSAFYAAAPIRFGITPEQIEILSHLSTVYLDDGMGGQVKTLRVSENHLQNVNGAGATVTTNGVGNLIVGFNEPGQPYCESPETQNVRYRRCYDQHTSAASSVPHLDPGGRHVLGAAEFCPAR